MKNTQLKTVASSPALLDWARACPDNTFPGTCRIEKRHATYLFRNASCFAASGRGPRAGTTSSDLVGMKIAGWLLPDNDPNLDDEARWRLANGGIRVSRNWHPRARAVLFGKTGLLGSMRIAVTSPVDAFTRHGTEEVERLRPPAFNMASTGSLTRIGLVAAAMG
jgi:hypothetical protein